MVVVCCSQGCKTTQHQPAGKADSNSRSRNSTRRYRKTTRQNRNSNSRRSSSTRRYRNKPSEERQPMAMKDNGIQNNGNHWRRPTVAMPVICRLAFMFFAFCSLLERIQYKFVKRMQLANHAVHCVYQPITLKLNHGQIKALGFTT